MTKVRVHASSECFGYRMDRLYYGEAFTEADEVNFHEHQDNPRWPTPRSHQSHSTVCWCLNDSAECCRPNCSCHDDDEVIDS